MGTVGLGWLLGLMMLELFSKRTDSVILFRDSLVVMVGLGWRLDSMILQVFSNLNDCDSIQGHGLMGMVVMG